MAVAGEVVKKLVKPKRGPRKGSLSKADIKKARANQKVIGEHAWAINYSGYKDLILQRQGVEPGYTVEELIEIKKYSEAFK